MEKETENTLVQTNEEKEPTVTMETKTTWPSSDFDNYEEDRLTINTDNTDIEIFGTDEQRRKMFTSLAKYFCEVENPENTIVNTFFKAKYSPLNEVLNAVRPVMGKYGLTVIQVPTFDNTNCAVNTLLTHEDGAWMSFPALKNKPTKMDIQGMGSTITYLRRFSINAIAGVMGEVDDDGNNATTGDPKPKLGKKEEKEETKEVNEAYETGMKYVTKGLTTEEKKARQSEVISIITKFAKSGKADDLKPEDRQKVAEEIKKLEKNK